MASPSPSLASAPAKQIYATGVTLFQVASQYLKDATQWDRIAALNGISDPWLTGAPATLLIPPVNAAASGQVVIPADG